MLVERSTMRSLCCSGRMSEMADQIGENIRGTLMMRILCTMGGKSPLHAWRAGGRGAGGWR